MHSLVNKICWCLCILQQHWSLYRMSNDYLISIVPYQTFDIDIIFQAGALIVKLLNFNCSQTSPAEWCMMYDVWCCICTAFVVICTNMLIIEFQRCFATVSFARWLSQPWPLSNIIDLTMNHCTRLQESFILKCGCSNIQMVDKFVVNNIDIFAKTKYPDNFSELKLPYYLLSPLNGNSLPLFVLLYFQFFVSNALACVFSGQGEVAQLLARGYHWRS